MPGPKAGSGFLEPKPGPGGGDDGKTGEPGTGAWEGPTDRRFPGLQCALRCQAPVSLWGVGRRRSGVRAVERPVAVQGMERKRHWRLRKSEETVQLISNGQGREGKWLPVVDLDTAGFDDVGLDGPAVTALVYLDAGSAGLGALEDEGGGWVSATSHASAPEGPFTRGSSISRKEEFVESRMRKSCRLLPDFA